MRPRLAAHTVSVLVPYVTDRPEVRRNAARELPADAPQASEGRSR